METQSREKKLRFSLNLCNSLSVYFMQIINYCDKTCQSMHTDVKKKTCTF